MQASWRAAEAYHWLMLSQKQLYEGLIDSSMRTVRNSYDEHKYLILRQSLRLVNYEDILDPKDIYSIIALTSYYNKHFLQCSNAFIKLETLEDATPADRESFQNLALDIFTR